MKHFEKTFASVLASNAKFGFNVFNLSSLEVIKCVCFGPVAQLDRAPAF